MACGEMGLGDWICEMERGRPLGMSAVAARDSRRVEEECLDVGWREEDLEVVDLVGLEEEEDLEEGTSRMLRARPVVGSVVEASAGLWETW